MWLRVLPTAAKVILFPLYLLVLFIDEISGEGWWYRRQRRRMTEERPALSDEEFLSMVNAAQGDASRWLAVRQVVAEEIGIPPEAVYPIDRLADLWRMQWVGPDPLDFLIRMERVLGKELEVSSLFKFVGPLRYGQPGEFREFAEGIVRGLAELRVR